MSKKNRREVNWGRKVFEPGLRLVTEGSQPARAHQSDLALRRALAYDERIRGNNVP